MILPPTPTRSASPTGPLRLAEAQGVDPSNIFVAGHSSGGAQAGYIAVKTGLGGDTCGRPTSRPPTSTPGYRPTSPTSSTTATLWATSAPNPNRVDNLLMGVDIVRYGRPTDVGQASDTASHAAADRLYGSSDLGTAAAASLVIQGVVNHHLIGDYAADLGVTLPGGNGGQDRI